MDQLGALPDSFVELLGALPDAVVVATTDGRIAAVNAHLCVLAAASAGDLIDMPIETLVLSGEAPIFIFLDALNKEHASRLLQPNLTDTIC